MNRCCLQGTCKHEAQEAELDSSDRRLPTDDGRSVVTPASARVRAVPKLKQQPGRKFRVVESSLASNRAIRNHLEHP